MKKHYMLGLMLLGCTAAMAQVRPASQPQQLLSAPMGLMAPVWSPDGSKIAVTTDNYAGIYVANADGSDLRVVTQDAGAGYKMVWSADSRAVEGRANIVAGNGLTRQMRSYNVATGAVTEQGARRRTSAQPAADKADGIYGAMISDPAQATSVVPALARFAGRTVINPALSPDGTKIAFQIPGKGMWLVNADGTGLRSLGKGSHPAWMPDSRNILYTVVEDNGSQFTSSVLMSLDTTTGNGATVVAVPSLLPLTPAVAPDGRRVAFENAVDASIYVVELKK